MTTAIKVAGALVLVEDDKADAALAAASAVNAEARTARAADVPIRDDLPKGHPLRGKRALRAVPCGWPDCTLDDRGQLVPVDLATGEPIATDPAPGTPPPGAGSVAPLEDDHG